MDFVARIFDWIGTQEEVLSGIAAAIVILGVLYAGVRNLLGRKSAEQGEQPPDAARTAAGAAIPSSKPSIAVMPFANLSGDPEHEFLADGLTEDIILGLSRVKQLFVIARNSCFTYKGRPADPQLVSQELGVRYVLEGSVRRAGDRIRVTAQLVDASNRTTTWAEQFDRKVEQILEVDDEVTEAIVAALQPALRRAEAELARRAAPEDLTAWALVNRAWVAVQSDLGDADVAREAISACQEALALDPDYAFGHAVLAHAKSLLVHQPEPDELKADALASIRRALELDSSDPLVHHCHAALLGNLGLTDDAMRAWQRAIELDPNNAGARAGLGIAMIFKQRSDEALGLIDSALLRSPADPLQYHWLGHRAMALALTRRSEEAIEVARASVERRPSRLAYSVLAGALAHLDRLDEAGEAWLAFASRYPGLVAQDFARMVAGLAPEPEWGEVLRRDLERAVEAAGATTAPD